MSYGLVEKIENIQAADFIKGANPINEVVRAFVTHQKDAGRYNDYVSNVLLENIDKISIDLIGKELFGSYAEDNFTSACRMLLQKENIDEGLKQPNEAELDLKHQEFIRRIEKDGFQFVKAEKYDPDIQRDYYSPDRIYKDNAEILIINEDGEMLYQPEKRKEAFQIFDIRNDVNEYVSAYENAKDTGAKSNIGYYTAMDWGKCVLGIRQSEYLDYQFVTW